MSSDPLSKFLKANAAPPPAAPADELPRILSRREPARPTRRVWAGGGLALLSFALAFTFISQQPEIRQAGIKVAATPRLVSTPIPGDVLDREVSDFFEETLDRDEAEDTWSDGEFLL